MMIVNIKIKNHSGNVVLISCGVHISRSIYITEIIKLHCKVKMRHNDHMILY